MADPHSKPCRKTKNANHVVVCRIAGEMPAPDVAVADTRLMHVSAHKTVLIVERPDISAKCVCPTVRMRSHVHDHVCRQNQSMLLGMSANQPVALKKTKKTNMRTQLHMVKQ